MKNKKPLIIGLAVLSALSILIGLYMTVSIWNLFHFTMLSDYAMPLRLVLFGFVGFGGAIYFAKNQQ